VPLVDEAQALRVAEALRPALEAYKPDEFVDPRFYPPRGAEPRTVAMYFLVMVAMDHRLSRPRRPYEACLPGDGCYHGADLLYRLGALRLERDPGFYTVERLEKITPGEIRAWLCAGSACPPDPEARAALLRDLARKLRLLYRGDPLELLDTGYLHTWTPGDPGLAERLRVFEAYSDPVEKKTMLLAKFLERRGLLRIRDPWNKRVPLDNHLARIALRLRLVVLEENLARKVEHQLEATPWEDIAVRIAAREAWHRVAEAIPADDFILDDILWTMGRRVCTAEKPRCRAGCPGGHPACAAGGGCRLRPVCPTGLGLQKPVREHLYLDTYWY